MQLRYHSNFDISTYRGVGFAVFILSYSVILTLVPEWDWLISLSMSTVLGIAVSQFLVLYIIRSKGLCLEVRFSRSRPNISALIVWQGLKKIDEVFVDTNSGRFDDKDILIKYRFLTHMR